MLVFYCYFVGGWSGSAVTFMMLQLVPAFKEQLVDCYGFSILLNIRNSAVQAVFYCLYAGFSLLKVTKKRHAWQHFVALLTLFPFMTIAPPFTDKKPPHQKQHAPQHVLYPLW